LRPAAGTKILVADLIPELPANPLAKVAQFGEAIAGIDATAFRNAISAILRAALET
jgi:hypothetical protein